MGHAPGPDRRAKQLGVGVSQQPTGKNQPLLSQSALAESTGDASVSAEPLVKYSISGGFVAFLQQHNIALALTSYQSGRLYLISRNPKGGLMVNEQYFRKAMGLSVSSGTIHLAALGSVIRLENILRPGQWINETFTHCYVPRAINFTGALDAHDLGVTSSGDILFVNTRYNCLSVLSQQHSFKPVWKPRFISEIINEDRCHLNGLAMHNGQPRYVTSVSRSNTIDGWRDRRADGGIVIDVEKNEIVCEGLSMPHSPRWHKDRLWLLNSGTGELGWVDFQKREFRPLTFCPGFARGLFFYGDFAIVGLSRPRYERFEGLDLDRRLREADSEAWTGLQIIDLNRKTCVHWFRIDGKISELYDTAVLPNVGCAKSIGFPSDEALDLITNEDM